MNKLITKLGQTLGIKSPNTDKPKDDPDTSSNINPQIYSMEINVNVTNRFTRTLITSKVRNLSINPSETTFSVILPENAFISEFEMEVDGVIYKAYVKEKEEAKQIYQQAVFQGQSAAHVEVSARDSKTFTVSVNIEPKNETIFRLVYEELLQRENGQYEIVMNIHPGQFVEDFRVQVNINESRPLTFVRTPSLRTGNEIRKQDEKLNPSAEIHMINPTSAIVKFNPDVSQQKVFTELLGNSTEIGLAGQFVVQYDVTRDPQGGEVLVHDGYFVHFFAPSELEPLPKHIVFVLDHSGSMGGRKLEQLTESMQNILSELKTVDLFNIIRFSTHAAVCNITENRFDNVYIKSRQYGNLEPQLRELHLPEPVKATKQNIEKAKNAIKSHSDMGCTNIIFGLEVGLFLVKVIQENTPDKYQPMIIFLTDGLPNEGISSPNEIIKTVNKINSEMRAPIFSLSFGTGADKNFLKKLSAENRGFSRHIYEAADASLQLEDFYSKISSPLLSDVTFKYVDGITEVTKVHYHLFFNGSELVVAGKIREEVNASLEVNGLSSRGRVVFKACRTQPVSPLERLWAYLTVKQILNERETALNAEELTKKALALSLKYSFVTPVSSLVVVKPDQKKDTVDSKKADPDEGSGNMRLLARSYSSTSPVFGGCPAGMNLMQPNSCAMSLSAMRSAPRTRSHDPFSSQMGQLFARRSLNTFDSSASGESESEIDDSFTSCDILLEDEEIEEPEVPVLKKKVKKFKKAKRYSSPPVEDTPDDNSNPFTKHLKSFKVESKEYQYYDLSALGSQYDHLPYSIRILLESAVRNCDNFQVKEQDVLNILNWAHNQLDEVGIEVPFKPARVILQDFTGVPAVVDFAAMRDAVKGLGGDPEKINPSCPVDLVIDHSVQVDFARSPGALKKNEELEFERNEERFTFLKWGAKAFNNMLIVPPGSGIVHQVNLEYLARVVFTGKEDKPILYPDTVVGTDSHTTMINGLGVLGWGVGGIEAEAVMLGQSISMLLPQVVGYRLYGRLGQYVTSTDLVLTVTKHLRQLGVVGKFVEFYGPGVAELSIADRATIANMCPEYGATVGFFPVDQHSLNYLRQTSRSEEQVKLIEAYLKATKQLRDYASEVNEPIFSESVSLDLSTVVSSVSGPKRPNDRVSVSEMKGDFQACLSNKIGFKGFGIPETKMQTEAKFMFDSVQYTIRHGSVIIAAITSCTNTSNPSVMLGAGLLARNAVAAGLTVAPYIKTSLSPGSGVVTYYLKESKVIDALTQLGFDIVGYGCMTCIGNSGGIDENIVNAIEQNDLVCCGVLSGNRNFEGRIHPNTRANYLASPLLVIAYAIAGTVDIDFESEPLGTRPDGTSVFLRDIWPTRKEIQAVEQQYVIPAMFQQVYSKIELGSQSWQTLNAPSGILYPWAEKSTYIKRPPFFDGMTISLPTFKAINGARVLLFLGDSVTTDHISPAGSIGRNSPAARYLAQNGLTPREFNSYGSRRGNDAVMSRGTFANIRLVNKFMSKAGPKTMYLPTNEEMDVYDCAERYKASDIPLIIIAGKDYGSGSSRDWAAKGPYLLGVRAVIAESFERIHRSNLVGMGIIPLQFLENENADSLGLTGKEVYSIQLPSVLKPGQEITISTNSGKTFNVLLRFDTEVDLLFYQNGGILNYMIRKMLA